MTEVLSRTLPEAPAETDLVAEVHRVLAASGEPLTLSKIRALLPAACRRLSPEELAECLRRQVAAGALQPFPKYRSSQDRFWDRSMPVHLVALLREALQDGPLVWSELRRKLPAYAQAPMEAVLQEQIAQGLIHRHPRAGSRGGERFGIEAPNPRDYLQSELSDVFNRLTQRGFTLAHLRAAALELLHEQEWAPTPPAEPAPPQAEMPPEEGPAVLTSPPSLAVPEPAQHLPPPLPPAQP